MVIADLIYDETQNGIKYAYDKTKVFNVEYDAECIEHGEKFYSTFYAPANYTKKQLMDIGQNIALTWGVECIDVQRVSIHK